MIPIHQGRRVRYGKDGEQIVEDFEGYYLTVDEILEICIHYAGEYRIDDPSDTDKIWIEQKLKEL